MEFGWKNLVAYMVWKCKLCGDLMDRDGVGMHMNREHGMRGVTMLSSTAYSKDFEYPSVINATNAESTISG